MRSGARLWSKTQPQHVSRPGGLGSIPSLHPCGGRGGVDFAAVSVAIKRFEKRLERERKFTRTRAIIDFRAM
jgi:hypothetical protein